MFRVGSARYVVKIMPGPIVIDGEPCDGVCHARTNTIQISPEVPPARRFFVMCHEILHGWLFATGGRVPADVEAACDLFATAAEQLVIDLVGAGGVEALTRLRPGETFGKAAAKIGLLRTRICSTCDGSVPLGDTLFRRARNTPDLIDCAMYCDFCGVTYRWQERATVGGAPSGEVVTEQSIERGNTLHLPDLSKQITAEMA